MNVSENSCFQTVEILMKVAILPTHTAHPMDAVREQLNSSLFKYNEKMKGIPLSYSDVKFPPGKEYGRIMNDQPWIHVDVITSLVVFTPVVGSKLEGKISKISDNHISILVLAMFNASIPISALKRAFKYNSASNTWISNTQELSEGDVIDFEVVSFQHMDGVIQIEGKLMSV